MKKLTLLIIFALATIFVNAQIVSGYKVKGIQSVESAGVFLLNGDTIEFASTSNGQILKRVDGKWINTNSAFSYIQYSADTITWSSTYDGASKPPDMFVRFSSDSTNWSSYALLAGDGEINANSNRIVDLDPAISGTDAPNLTQVIDLIAEVDLQTSTDNGAITTNYISTGGLGVTGDIDITGTARASQNAAAIVGSNLTRVTDVKAIVSDSIADRAIISGVPVNNQVAVFTDANTIEGALGLTYGSGTFSVIGTGTISDNTTIGLAGSSEKRPTFSIIGDADSDAADVDETFALTLTPQANPVQSTWGFTSTQSAGYTFDKKVTIGGTGAVSTIANSTGDFLTAPTNGGLITQRTAAQVLSDIGAKASSDSTANAGYVSNYTLNDTLSEYVKTDGSIPLTANWDAGSNTIRAEVFQSDVAEGIAPFSVSSSTKVDNLNAELLNDNPSSYFKAGIDSTANSGYVSNYTLNDTLSEYVKTDGSIPMTGNWDAGSVSITSGRFISDVGSSISPYSTSSTKLNLNLNADLLDSQEGAYYTTASNIDMDVLATPTYTSVQDWSNSTQSAGVISGGVITDSGSGEIDISALTGIVKTTNSSIGVNVFFDYAGAVNQTLTNYSTNYIAISYNLGTPQLVIGTTSTANGHTIFNLGKVYREGTSLDIITSGLHIDDFSKRVQQHHMEEADLHFVSGAIVGETTYRSITVTAGVLYAGLNRIPTDAINTFTGDDFEYYYNDGAWQESDETRIDSLQYNNVGVGLATLANNQYGVHWVYKGTGSSTYVIYGQDSYTLNEAQSVQPPSSLPDHVSGFGVLRAKIIIEKSDGVFTEIESVEDTEFSSSTPSNHDELANINLAASGQTYGHIDDQTQSIAGEKTFTDDLNITASKDGLLGTNVTNSFAGATTVAGATNRVTNDNGYYGLMGMTNSGSTLGSSAFINTLHFYNQGYGNTLFTTDGNKGFIWHTDPTDSHNYSALSNPVMSLSAGGILEVSDDIIGLDSIRVEGKGLFKDDITVNGKIALDGTTIAYRPTAFTGSLILGDGGTNLSNTTATEGYYNTFVGLGAGNANTTGEKNTASGLQTLYSNTTGDNNTASGYHALYSNTTGVNNTASGRSALYSNTTGDNNTASGYYALYSNTEGNYNTASGYQALYSNTTGTNNTASGMQALYSNTTGTNNTANGYQSLYSNTTGTNNTANGYKALNFNTTGTNNTAYGYNALFSNTTGANNTASGYQSLYSNTEGNYNTANGYYALYSNTEGNSNTANGYSALYYNTTGTNNTASGMQALYSNTTGSYNTASGYNALFSNTTGANNTAYGYNALNFNTTGTNNTASGMQALYSNTTGTNNTANGYQSLYYNTTGTNNTANGYKALNFNTTGTNNTAYGYNALFSNTTGANNTASGYQSLYSNTEGNYNTANGYYALYDLNILDGTGNNTALGYNTGRGIVTGTGNTILGANITGLASDLTNHIILSDGAGNQRINVDEDGNVGIDLTTGIDSILTVNEGAWIKGGLLVDLELKSSTLSVDGLINTNSTTDATSILTGSIQSDGGVGIKKDVFVGGNITLETGAANGYMLVSDANGKGSWTTPTASGVYYGTWNANTNTPTLANGSGTAGDWYRCVVAGTTDFGAGGIAFTIGDDAFYNGSVWQNVPAVGYTLQTATSTVLGGVKLGASLEIGEEATDRINIKNGDKGDIDISSDGLVFTIDTASVNNLKIATEVDAVKIANGSVTNTEFQYINTLGSNAQTQISAKADTSLTALLATENTFAKDQTFSKNIIHSTEITITASTTQTQGQQPLTKDINEISYVTNANDVVTMQPAQAGLRIVIINNGSNTLQIFPASGDNLGVGVDTSVTLASGSNIEYVSYNTTNWETI